MGDYFEDKKRLEEEDKKKAAEIKKKTEELKKQIKSPLLKGLLDFVEGIGEAGGELVSAIGSEIAEPAERQMYDILGERIRWLSPVDKYEILRLPLEERTDALLKLKEKFDRAGTLSATGTVAKSDKADEVSEEDIGKLLFAELQDQVKTAEALIVYQDKIQSDVDWKYRDQPERRDKIKKVLNQLFMRYRNEQGW